MNVRDDRGFESVTVPDHRGRGFIRIERGPHDDFFVTVQHDGASARAKSFLSPGHETLHEYFLDLAQRWRGWTGIRLWESPGFRMWATHDGRSQALLEVELSPYSRPETWRLNAFIAVAPGELEGIALDLREMFDARERTRRA